MAPDRHDTQRIECDDDDDDDGDDKNDNEKPGKVNCHIGECEHHFLCTDLLGRLILLRRYRVVIERVVISHRQTSCDIGDDPDREQTELKYYIAFSMKDAYVSLGGRCLYGYTLFLSHHLIGAGRKRSAEESDANLIIYKQLFRLISRDTLHVRQQTAAHASLAFYATVEFLGAVEKEDLVNYYKTCTHDVSIVHPETITDAECVPSRRIVLCFTRETTRWFSFLHPGSLYWLKKKCTVVIPADENNIFLTYRLEENVLRSVIRTEAKRYIQMDANIHIVMKSMVVSKTAENKNYCLVRNN